jgi:hypothetical protein
VCRNYINSEEILSHTNGNFEDQNKVLEFSIIFINCCIKDLLLMHIIILYN